jgi:hypothetical protein
LKEREFTPLQKGNREISLGHFDEDKWKELMKLKETIVPVPIPAYEGVS